MLEILEDLTTRSYIRIPKYSTEGFIRTDQNSTEITYIYTLVSTRDIDKVKYVGKTTNPSNRAATHKYGSENYSSHTNRWIAKERKEGFDIVMTIIDQSIDNWQEMERGYIRLFKALGANLCNKTEGGDTSAKRKGVKQPLRQKTVVMLSKEGNILKEFESVILAALEVNGNRHVIGNVCRGKRPSAYGYKWNFKKEGVTTCK